MLNREHQIDAALRHAARCYEKERYREATCVYVRLHHLVTEWHGQLTPCRAFRNRPYLRIFKAELYSAIGACLTSMHSYVDAHELYECSLKMCPRDLTYQRLILLAIKTSKLAAVESLLDKLLKPRIVRRSIVYQQNNNSATRVCVGNVEVHALKAALTCYSGSVSQALNAVCTTIMVLLQELSGKASSDVNTNVSASETEATRVDGFHLPRPSALDYHEQHRCRVVFLTVCNVLQTFLHRGATLPLRCDYNIEKLIYLLYGKKIEGVCLSIISSPAVISFAAYDLFLKYGGKDTIPGLGLNSIDTLYTFYQCTFTSVLDHTSLPVKSAIYFTDRVFSPLVWEKIASKNILYGKLKDQIVMQNQLLEIVDDTDLMSYIMQVYEIKPLSCLFTLSDAVVAMISGTSAGFETHMASLAKSFSNMVSTREDSTLIARIMRSKENETVRAFLLHDDVSGENQQQQEKEQKQSPLHHSHVTESTISNIRSHASLKGSLTAKLANYLRMSVTRTRSTHASGRDSTAESVVTQLSAVPTRAESVIMDTVADVPVPVPDRKQAYNNMPNSINMLMESVIDTVPAQQDTRRAKTAPLSVIYRSTVATRASCKAAERVHLSDAFRTKEADEYRPSYADTLDRLANSCYHMENLPGNAAYSAALKKRISISLPSYSALKRTEMTVPNVHLTTLQRLLPKQANDRSKMRGRSALLCTNLPIFRTSGGTKPMVVKASALAGHKPASASTSTLKSKSEASFLTVPPNRCSLPDLMSYQASISLSRPDNAFIGTQHMHYPARSCISCPTVWSRERTRKVHAADQARLRNLHDAVVSADARHVLSLSTQYYREVAHMKVFRYQKATSLSTSNDKQERPRLGTRQHYKHSALLSTRAELPESAATSTSDSMHSSLCEEADPSLANMRSRVNQFAQSVIESQDLAREKLMQAKKGLLALSRTLNAGKHDAFTIYSDLLQSERRRRPLSQANTVLSSSDGSKGEAKEQHHTRCSVSSQEQSRPSLPDLGTILAKTPVRFADYLLTQVDLELVHTRTHYERRLLLNNHAESSSNEENTKGSAKNEHTIKFKVPKSSKVKPMVSRAASLPDRPYFGQSYTKVPQYVPNYQEYQYLELSARKATVCSEIYSPKPVHPVLRGVALELAQSQDQELPFATSADEEQSNSDVNPNSHKLQQNSSYIPYYANTNAPSVQLRDYSICRGDKWKRHQTRPFIGSALFKKHSRQRTYFADILLSPLWIIGSEASASRTDSYMSMIRTMPKEGSRRGGSGTYLTSLAPRMPARTHRRNLLSVICRLPLGALTMRSLRLRTASFLFKTML